MTSLATFSILYKLCNYGLKQEVTLFCPSMGEKEKISADKSGKTRATETKPCSGAKRFAHF